MTKISIKEVDKVASLADLELSEKEKKEFSSQLTDVFEYIDTLNELRTDSVDPTSQTTGLTNVQRSDEINVNRVLSTQDVIKNSTKVYNDYFVVDALLDKEKNKS